MIPLEHNTPNDLTPALAAYINQSIATAVAQTTVQMQLYAAIPGRERQRSINKPLGLSSRQALLTEYPRDSPIQLDFDRITDALEEIATGGAGSDGLIDMHKQWPAADNIDATVVNNWAKTFAAGFIPKSVLFLVTKMNGSSVSVQPIIDFGTSVAPQKYLAAKQLIELAALNDTFEVASFLVAPDAESDLRIAITTPGTVLGSGAEYRISIFADGRYLG